MGENTMRTQYNSNARLMHWLTVLLVVVAWTMARFGERLFDDGIDVLHTATAIGLGVHLWTGLAVLIIAVLRFRWRIANPPPPPEFNEFSRWLISWIDPSRRLTQYGLYILLVAVPVVGILLLLAEGKFPAAFGLADVGPSFGVTGGSALILWQLHVGLANLLLIVAIFHAVAAVLHYAVFHDGTLVRMVPWLRRDNHKIP